MCESYVQPWSKPFFSPFCSTSTRRVYGGSGNAVRPKLSICSSSRSLAGNEHIAASPSGWRALERGHPGRPHGHECQGPGDGEGDEGDPPVAGQREGEAYERRADQDQERGAAVDEPDGGAGGVGTKR